MADRSVRVTLSANVDGFTSALSKARSSVDTLSKSVGEASQTQGWKTASTAMIGFGVTALSVGVMAVRAYAAFDEQMAKVAATGEDARSNLSQLRDIALEAGLTTKFSATEAAAGIEDLAKAGISAKDIIGGALSASLSLAATDMMSVSEAAETVATTMIQFNLSGSQAGHVSDLLAAGAGKAMGSVKDLSDALKNGGLVASNMGLSVEETTGTLAAFAQNGIVGAEAGTQLKVMLQRLQNPAADAQKVMKDLGISAYDSSGKFVGMADVAEQLRGKTKDLTQEQRDQALATLFGSHAINAATVLYKEGAAGIKDWTDKVNDQGYAADVAARKMDNLKGDLTKLGAAWNNLMINVGGSADGPLRGIVQGVTGLVKFLSDNKDAAAIVVGIVSALGGFALVAGIVMKVTTSLVEFRTAVETLRAAEGIVGKFSNSAVSFLGNVAKAASLAGIAFGATQLAVSGLNKALGEDKITWPTSEADAFDKALKEIAASGGKATTQITKLFTIASTNSDISGIKDLGDALKQLANTNGWTDFGEWTAKVFGEKNTITQAREQVQQLDKAMAQLAQQNLPAASQAFKYLGEQIDREHLSTGQILERFPQLAQSLRDVAKEQYNLTLSDKEVADWMAGKTPQTIEWINAMKAAGMNTDGLTGKLAQQSEAAKKGAQSIADVTKAINDYANAALKLSGSQIGLAQAIDDASEAARKNGATLDINTQAGRNNQSALDSIAAAALRLRDSQIAQGKSTEEVNASTDRARQAFVDTAMQMGMTREAAEALAKQYGLIPVSVTTNVSAPGATTAAAQAQDFFNRLTMIPPETASKILAILQREGLDAAERALNNVARDRYSKVYVDESGTPYVTKGRRAGGYISGPGTGTSDSILTRLSDGEFVVKAQSVRDIGVGRLDYLNQTGKLPRFADGGSVTPARWDSYDRSVKGYAYRPIASSVVAENHYHLDPVLITDSQIDRYLSRALDRIMADSMQRAMKG